jgi:NADPH:quinone reductase-like Zn-dependent oxidoreductase
VNWLIMKYKRIVISEHGGPDVLQIIENEKPEPKPGEARIKVQAAGVAWADVMMRTGLYPGEMPPTPFTPGYDIAGIVDKLGDQDARVAIGQNVAAITKVGGYAEYLCIPYKNIAVAPDGVDPAQVTCLPLNYITAYQMLHRSANVQSGERVLIHGAAGGVGTALMQLGSLAELMIFGTASSKKQYVIEQLGGTPIDYTNEDFEERIKQMGGVDVVFDPIGGNHLSKSYNVLRNNGRLIAYGERSIVGEGVFNKIEAQAQEEFMNRWNTTLGNKSVQWYEVYDQVVGKPEWFQEDMQVLLDLLSRRKIEPLVAKRLPLDQAAYAHHLLETASVVGKIVLVCHD